MPPEVPGTADMPLWRAINPAPYRCQRLSANDDADVAIVGGGIAGLSTALHLRQQGIDVAVIDAAVAHADGACASAGIVAPQLVRNSPASILAKLGRDRGGALLTMVAQSGTHLFDTVRDHGIDCVPSQTGFLAPVAGQKPMRALRQAVEGWRPWRDDLRMLDAAETTALSGCIGYDGAVFDPSGGGVDPAALVDGLDRAAADAGARIYRGSRVTEVVRDGTGWRIDAPGGRITAKRVLLCANGGNAALHPALRDTVLPLPVCEVATRPLPADMRATILPQGQTLTDISTDVLSLRLDREGRLITALSISPKRSRAEIEHQVQSRLEAVLPGYRRVPLEYIWHGTAWLNSNLLPRTVLLDDGLAAVQACNGRGLGNNMIIGRELARWLHRSNYQPMVPLERPRRVPGFAVLRHLPRVMMAGSAMTRRLFDRMPSRRYHEEGSA